MYPLAPNVVVKAAVYGEIPSTPMSVSNGKLPSVLPFETWAR